MFHYHLTPLIYRPVPVTNILSGNTFSAGNVTVSNAQGATVIVNGQVGNTVTVTGGRRF